MMSSNRKPGFGNGNESIRRLVSGVYACMEKMKTFPVFVLVALCEFKAYAFVSHASTVGSPNDSFLAAKKTDQPKDVDAVTKASWYAVEAFGKFFGKKDAAQDTSDGKSATVYSTSIPPQSVKETKARLKEDNEREYFLSGTVDKLIYDEQCEFADPFVSFKGRDRFVENLENLGSFITKYSAKPLSYQELDDKTVQTKFMVKLQLNLPWKPVLAWPWGVRCEIDPETNLIVLHEESWDIDALEGVKQIFRKPTTSV